jgi:hypothetical protein
VCFSDNFSTIQNRWAAPVVSRDHEVCLAAEHAERRASRSTTEFGDAAAEGANSINGRMQNKIF